MSRRTLLTVTMLVLLSAASSARRLEASTIITGGNVSGIWTPAGSPYIIQGDITVAAGLGLTMNAGTIVQFASSDLQGSGTDISRVELTVHGGLAINGTTAQPVTLLAQSGTTNVWVGMIVASDAGSVALHHTVLENSTQGIQYSSGAGVLSLDEVTLDVNGFDLVRGSGGGNPAITGTLHAGRFAGDVVIPSGATLAVNRMSGLVQGGRFTLSAGSTYHTTLTSAANFNQLQIAGAITLAGTLDLDVSGLTSSVGQTFKIIDNTGGSVTGQFSGLPNGAQFNAGAYHFQIAYDGGDGNDVVLTNASGPRLSLGSGGAGLDFGSTTAGTAAYAPLTISNTGNQNLSISGMSFSGPNGASFSLGTPVSFPVNVAPADSVTYTVQFLPTARGTNTGTLTIASNDPASPNTSVSLTGFARGAVMTWSPPALAFANTSLDSSRVLSIALGNNGDAALQVSQLSLSGSPEFSLYSSPPLPFQVGVAASSSVYVRFLPTAAGNASATLQIASNDLANPYVLIPLTGTGVGQAIFVSPTALDYGDVYSAALRDMVIGISNARSGALVLQSFDLTNSGTPPAFSILSAPAPGTSLGAGQSASITVRLTPTSPGPLTATLVIHSNDPNTPNLAVPISANVHTEPHIAGVRDVPNDQGGSVKLSWDASLLDVPTGPVVDHYWVFRSVPPNAAQSAIQAGARLGRLEDQRARAGDASIFTSSSVQGTLYWERIAILDALHFIQGYSYVAPTRNDSTGTSNPLTLFMVAALDSGDAQFWPSAPDSGYSVDNLAPLAPASFAGTYRSGVAHLHWGVNREADLAVYRIYAGASASFVPGPGNLLVAKPDTGYATAGSAGRYFKISAIDVHGNESGFSHLSPADILHVEEDSGGSLAFAFPAPDPSHGPVDLSFTLSRAGPVTLEIFDQQGRRVRTLVRGGREAGDQHVRWDNADDAGVLAPSGLYFARLMAEGRFLTRRIALVR
jgi:flagellar hook capping protein FlgD/ASPM-SPD-2-Hydin domain-containing protein